MLLHSKTPQNDIFKLNGINQGVLNSMRNVKLFNSAQNHLTSSQFQKSRCFQICFACVFFWFSMFSNLSRFIYVFFCVCGVVVMKPKRVILKLIVEEFPPPTKRVTALDAPSVPLASGDLVPSTQPSAPLTSSTQSSAPLADDGPIPSTPLPFVIEDPSTPLPFNQEDSSTCTIHVHQAQSRFDNPFLTPRSPFTPHSPFHTSPLRPPAAAAAVVPHVSPFKIHIPVTHTPDPAPASVSVSAPTSPLIQPIASVAAASLLHTLATSAITNKRNREDDDSDNYEDDDDDGDNDTVSTEPRRPSKKQKQRIAVLSKTVNIIWGGYNPSTRLPSDHTHLYRQHCLVLNDIKFDYENSRAQHPDNRNRDRLAELVLSRVELTPSTDELLKTNKTTWAWRFYPADNTGKRITVVDMQDGGMYVMRYCPNINSGQRMTANIDTMASQFTLASFVRTRDAPQKPLVAIMSLIRNVQCISSLSPVCAAVLHYYQVDKHNKRIKRRIHEIHPYEKDDTQLVRMLGNILCELRYKTRTESDNMTTQDLQNWSIYSMESEPAVSIAWACVASAYVTRLVHPATPTHPSYVKTTNYTQTRHKPIQSIPVTPIPIPTPVPTSTPAAASAASAASAAAAVALAITTSQSTSVVEFLGEMSPSWMAHRPLHSHETIPYVTQAGLYHHHATDPISLTHVSNHYYLNYYSFGHVLSDVYATYQHTPIISLPSATVTQTKRDSIFEALDLALSVGQHQLQIPCKTIYDAYNTTTQRRAIVRQEDIYMDVVFVMSELLRQVTPDQRHFIGFRVYLRDRTNGGLQLYSIAQTSDINSNCCIIQNTDLTTFSVCHHAHLELHTLSVTDSNSLHRELFSTHNNKDIQLLPVIERMAQSLMWNHPVSRIDTSGAGDSVIGALAVLLTGMFLDDTVSETRSLLIEYASSLSDHSFSRICPSSCYSRLGYIYRLQSPTYKGTITDIRMMNSILGNSHGIVFCVNISRAQNTQWTVVGLPLLSEYTVQPSTPRSRVAILTNTSSGLHWVLDSAGSPWQAPAPAPAPAPA
jgi:hypothetical protein